MAELPKEVTLTVKVDGAQLLGQAVAKQISEILSNDKEGMIRQALIDLGWTPPPGSTSN